jgi:hypothetical protein
MAFSVPEQKHSLDMGSTAMDSGKRTFRLFFDCWFAEETIEKQK